jgi:hypothetical protein
MAAEVRAITSPSAETVASSASEAKASRVFVSHDECRLVLAIQLTA